ncbi:MAG: alanine racemase [Clostridia bacterium]|nr:alanine racemase [Clostridia bacterium]
MQYRRTYIQVDLGAIAANTETLVRAVAPTPHTLAVVKANAYGHGLAPVAKTALAHGADWLGVAIPEEGQALREAGVGAPILVLGAVNATGAEASVRFQLTQTVFDEARVRMLETEAARQGTKAKVHLKIDSGMGRIGVRTEEELQSVLRAIDESPHVQLTGAFTHFADADGETDDYSHRQIERFERLRALLPGGILIHAAASAASLKYPNARYDMVRQGISLYGCPPIPDAPRLIPALSWHTEIAYVKPLSAGECVSYGCTFRAEKDMLVATLPVGYGDGYHRALSGKAKVLIGGTRCPVLGRVCMDQIMVDVTDAPRDQLFLGAPVVLLGSQGDETITADEVASWAGTISYEILLSVTARVPVKYIHDETA